MVHVVAWKGRSDMKSNMLEDHIVINVKDICPVPPWNVSVSVCVKYEMSCESINFLETFQEYQVNSDTKSGTPGYFMSD